ncbi:MAG: extracellular solute-binding protein [Halodesulfurarchaeum sp.]
MHRRDFLAGVGTTALGGLAGCLGGGQSNPAGAEFDPEPATVTGQAPQLTDLPDLSGELTVYLGRGEGGLYRELLEHFETELYPDLELSVRRDSSASLANTIVEEEKHGNSPADVFWSIDVGALGAIAQRGLGVTLPTEVTGIVPDGFRDSSGRWVGISGRARAIPYNTETYDESDVPETVAEIPETPGFGNNMGWAPTYAAFQSFVTAMRLLRGESETRQWLTDMQDMGVSSYGGEFMVTNAVAEGELDAGFANHYYALRLAEAKPDAPLDLAFTSGDAGALINASGALVLQSSRVPTLATDFIAHFLTAEVQSFLAEKAYEYPLVPGIDPPGSLPSIEELNPPSIDLTKLANVRPTLRLMRETGVL